MADPQATERGDAVLDVKQIALWAGCIGNRTNVVPIADAKHDVFPIAAGRTGGGLSGAGRVAGLVPKVIWRSIRIEEV
jgi:hypothetical protein